MMAATVTATLSTIAKHIVAVNYRCAHWNTIFNDIHMAYRNLQICDSRELNQSDRFWKHTFLEFCHLKMLFLPVQKWSIAMLCVRFWIINNCKSNQ